MFKVYPIRTEFRGQTFNASYLVKDGRVCVMSAYGSQSAPAGDGQRDLVAARLLSEIVQAREAGGGADPSSRNG